MTDIKNKLNKIIPLSKTNLFYKNKLILSANTLKNLEKDIRENINPPKNDKIVFIVRVVYDPDDESNILTISCSKKIINSELELVNVVGTMKNFVYTLNDFKNIGFNKNYLKKIIKVVDKKLLGKKITSNINEINSIDI
jgi:hypothetical protein